MAKMPDNFVDLTVTSPPYDNLRDYKGYCFPFEEIAKELFRITKEGGVVVWVVGDATINGSESGTSFRQALFFKECGFNLHDTMIYKKHSYIHQNCKRHQQEFEFMFVFSKGEIKTFNVILMPRLSKEKRLPKHRIGDKDYGKYVRVEPKEEKKIGNVWTYANTTNNTSHPAVFPEQLCADHIYSWSNEGDVVYDCFGGSGTTAKMAHLMKRNWILSEISSEYCQIAEKRIAPYLAQITLF